MILSRAGPRQDSMTRWTRNDPPIMSVENTDHWTKLRVKSYNLGSQSARPALARCPHMPPDQRDLMKENFQSRMRELKGSGDGRYDSKGASIFANVKTRDIHGNIPGDYTVARPKTTPNRSLMRTSYNERARQGYKYWYQERPRPTSFGRYGIGGYKTVLGLGSGPRT